MLRRIQIHDFAIIENLELELNAGMTVITGETGAGKSIVIEALDVALGDRADSKIVRHGAERCEVIVEFDLTHIHAAQAWLTQADLARDEACIIRRVINASDGRSRHYINGSLVNQQQLRELGRLLMHIHGQHQHQALIKRDEQRQLLDLYGGYADLLAEVAQAYAHWHQFRQQIDSIHISSHHEAEMSLLRYQVEELEQTYLTPEEIIQLQHDHKQQTNAELLLTQAQNVLSLLTDSAEANLLSLTNQVCHLLSQIQTLTPRLDNAVKLLTNITIELNESENEVRDFIENIDIDPAQLQQLEQRLNIVYQLARKHKINLEQLPDYFTNLKHRLAQLENSQVNLDQLIEAENMAKQHFHLIAQKLYQHRVTAANQLNQFVSDNMQQLGMPGGKFMIKIVHQTEHLPTSHGLDIIEFLVSANPGQPLQPLNKVASGGELSRISLAIQVITAQAVATPTLVFDEVDVGIGGGTAEIVGKVLRQLGQHAQVLCITHLPQVAAQGHHHLLIHKEVIEDQTHSHVTFLDSAARITELARMLGGVKINQHSLAHAQSMLEEVV